MAKRVMKTTGAAIDLTRNVNRLLVTLHTNSAEPQNADQ